MVDLEPERDMLYGSNSVQLLRLSQHNICLSALSFTEMNPMSLLQPEVKLPSDHSTLLLLVLFHLLNR